MDVSGAPSGNRSSAANPAVVMLAALMCSWRALQQGVTLSGVGTLGTPKMAQVVAFADELGGRKLHGRPGRRRKARRDLRETGQERNGRDD